MNDGDYMYYECDGLEFILHVCRDEYLFDVDYNGKFLLLDFGDSFEVTL